MGFSTTPFLSPDSGGPLLITCIQRWGSQNVLPPHILIPDPPCGWGLMASQDPHQPHQGVLSYFLGFVVQPAVFMFPLVLTLVIRIPWDT